MAQEKLVDVEFISKKRYANYEGCAFTLFTFKTADPYKIKKLREGKLFNKEYKEVLSEEVVDPEKIVKKNLAEIAKMEADLKQKKIEAGIFEEAENENEADAAIDNQFNKVIDALSYEDLKEKTKEAIENGGVKISLNAGKEALRDYLKGK